MKDKPGSLGDSEKNNSILSHKDAEEVYREPRALLKQKSVSLPSSEMKEGVFGRLLQKDSNKDADRETMTLLKQKPGCLAHSVVQ